MAELEGIILTRHAIDPGVPENNILVTASAANTAKEANAVMTLINQNQIIAKRTDGKRLLPSFKALKVTSALHMVRAKALFDHIGFKVMPFPVNFGVSAGSELT